MQIPGSVAVVTGGGGGLGAGAARMLTAHGGRVAILDLPSSPGAETAKELGEQALFLPTDITDPDQVRSAVAATVEAYGRIDVLVNAAGVSPAGRVVNRAGRLHPLDVFERTVRVNLTGVFDVIRQVAGEMAKNEPGTDGERGLIVNVSSAAATEGQRGQAAYTATKGGIAALTLQLARDLADFGIRVMAIAPGIMDTPMLAGVDAERRAALLDLHLFPKRLGTPDDFAALLKVFIEVTLLNGEVVRLDAGTRMAG
ncbi:SDR family NAD(P)-dependent oxidoreductase [Streptomyces ipomoeae]|uniref:SDR family NAD(P)-dependent oxidoreductase n=1 Tax=Streptomyces ipomoeae TaxID=103232 RepID=UPI0011476736|nr:SDR family NAD(P)-dependent oxidoreductase [Streptomyces ipomoeae]MDX2937775.1 SDR family NAD(P)-dependent oxidoreductase [Streptomyces ipomoeae]TQE17220.1 SDR family NAD(P)-dependent oxidoreductase [Streptomyces ipomoeae]